MIIPGTNYRVGIFPAAAKATLFQLPYRQAYYGGKVVYWTWWRLFVCRDTL